MKLKHNYGQYFTNDKLVNIVLDKTLKHVNNFNNCLEPSYGDGSFIYNLKQRNPDLEIDAFEIDSEIFLPIKNVNCQLNDFLFYNHTKKYSLIVGNPPYIELVYSFYNDEYKYKFKKMFSKKGRGRVNLVHAFFDTSFNLIENDGVISFLLPSSILTSPWYNDIRKTIYDDFSIKELIENIKFEGVSIQVCLLVIKKEKTSTKKYIVKKGNTYQINANEIQNSNCETIKKYGFDVGVGQYCWSHYTDKLNNENIGTKLLYSTYIKKNSIVENNISNVKKKKFLNIENPKVLSNVIVFPRTSSKEVRMVLLRDNTFVLENHVIYIKHDDVTKLIELYNYLNLNRELILHLLNSTNLTKTEVENLCVKINY
jgi:hypothetical protein